MNSPTRTLKLISWNVNKRRAVDRQARWLSARRPDIVALQEVAYPRIEPLAAHLARHGLPYSVSTRDTSPRDLRCDVMIASRWPLEFLEVTTSPMRQSLVSARALTPAGPIEIHNVHAPTSGTYGLRKIETLEAIYRALAVPAETHRVLLGDMNSPRIERASGEVVTFGQRVRKDGGTSFIRGDPRHDLAERNILLGLQRFGFRDAFREVHGYGVAGVSWRATQGKRNGFRLDHTIVSAGLVPLEARYLAEVMTGPDWLSDHAAMEVAVAFSPCQEPTG